VLSRIEAYTPEAPCSIVAKEMSDEAMRSFMEIRKRRIINRLSGRCVSWRGIKTCEHHPPACGHTGKQNRAGGRRAARLYWIKG
jgi:hypothetical protein